MPLVGGGLAGALDFELDARSESVPVARDRLAAWLERLEPSPEHLYAIKLVLTEAVANAVLHAYRESPQAEGLVRVRAQAYDSSVMLSVADAGTGMAPRHDSPGLGMGLPLIARLTDGLEIICMPAREAGTEVRMTFDLGEDGAARQQLVA
jgi:serine/threonine-protein kinase RsbW